MFKINAKLEKILLKSGVPFAVDENGVYTICEGGKVYSLHCGENNIIVKDNKYKNEFRYNSWLKLDVELKKVSKGRGFRVDLEKEREEFFSFIWNLSAEEDYCDNEFGSDYALRIVNEEFEESKRDIEIHGVSLCGYREDTGAEIIKRMFSGAIKIEELEERKEEIIERLIG